MKSISITVNITSKTIVILLALIIGVLGLKTVKDSYAQSSASPLTGSCGLILNRNFGGWEVFYKGANTVAQNFIGIINFDTGTFHGLTNMVSGYGTSQASESQQVFTDNQKGTITAGPVIGSYYLTAAGENTPSFVFVPVNGGNTFLVSELNTTKTSSTGVCQKI
jgi:hypothetical protein